MHTVTIEHIAPMAAVDLKNQLLAAGLEINRDFVWEYRAATYDNDGYSAVTPRMALFRFANAATATFYQLKWL